MTERYSSSYSGNFQSKWFKIESFDRASLEIVLTGTASGTIGLRFTNSVGANPPSDNAGQLDDDSVVALSNSFSWMWDVESGASWVRIDATCTGSGSFIVDFNGKR